MKLRFAVLCSLWLPLAAGAQTILVQPYVQPGNGFSLASNDVKVIRWLTDQKPGEFTVEFGPQNALTNVTRAARVALDFLPAKPSKAAPPKEPVPEVTKGKPAEPPAKKEPPIVIAEREQHYFKYTAPLTGLPFDTEIHYRVKLGDRVVREGAFPTRASAEKPIRFVMVGDIASGRPQQNLVAWQIAQVKPQFLVILGDIVYPSGRVSQYMHHFWSTYNQPTNAGPKGGAPLMASVPFYPALGNHDSESSKLPDVADSFGAYHFFSVPQNGPGLGPWNTPLGKDPAVSNAFRAAVGPSYPAVAFYSFDNGPAHFTILDSAVYVTNFTENKPLMSWLENDLKSTKAKWKFVCFHVPPFQATKTHYTEQRMRLLQPLFERTGVDIVWAGHVHNYQRSVPLRFNPNPPRRLTNGLVNGDFKLDTKFDGVTQTQPDGVIHIVSGGGGAGLYGGGQEKNAADFTKQYTAANWAPFTAKFFDKKHSFAVVDLTPARLELRALDTDGVEVDKMVITKP